MSVEFRIGGRVVCTSAFVDRPRRGERFPQVGEVLAIRALGPGISDRDDIYFLFEEIHNQPYRYNGCFVETEWWSKRFRPVRETSIDCLTALLAKPPVRLREDA